MDGMLNRCEDVGAQTIGVCHRGTAEPGPLLDCSDGPDREGRNAPHRHDGRGYRLHGLGSPIRGSKDFASSGTPCTMRWYAGICRRGNSLPDIVPGLAESWEVDKNDVPTGSSSCAAGSNFTTAATSTPMR